MRLASVSELLHSGEQQAVPCKYYAALCSGAVMFAEHRRKGGDSAKGPDGPALVERAMGLRTIFYHWYVALSSDVEDRVKIHRVSRNMANQNRTCALTEHSFNLVNRSID